MLKNTIPENMKSPSEIFMGGDFISSTSARDWIYSRFIEKEHDLYNPDHGHLRSAEIGVLWTNVPYEKKGRTVLGTAAMPKITGDAWTAGRRMQQLRESFPVFPDFIITVFAPYVWDANDIEVCALVEHELYHCAQALDNWGQPKFSKSTGEPVYTIRGHDVEEFVGVVARYGAYSEELRAMVDVAKKTAYNRGIVTAIAASCGTCQAMN